MESQKKQKTYQSMHVYFSVLTFAFMVISVLALSLLLLHQNKELTELREELDIIRGIYLGEQDGTVIGNASVEERVYGRSKRQVNPRYNYRNTQYQNRYRNTRNQNTRNTRLQNANNQQTRYQQNQNQRNRNVQNRYQQNRNQQNTNQQNRNLQNRNQQNRFQQNWNQQNRNQQNRNQQNRNLQNRNQQNRNLQNRNLQNRNLQNRNLQNRNLQNRNQQNRNQQNRNQQNRNQQNRNQQNRNLQNRNLQNRNLQNQRNRLQQNRNIRPKVTTTTKPKTTQATTAAPTTSRPTKSGGELTAFIDVREFWNAVSQKPLTTSCKRIIQANKQIICVKNNGKNITIDAQGRRIINGSLDLGAGREVSTAARNYIDSYVNHKLKTLLGTKITESKQLDEFIQSKVQEALDKRLKSGLVSSPQLGKAQVIAIAGSPGPRGFPGPRGYRGPRGFTGPQGRPGLAAIVGPGGRVRWISEGNTGRFIGVPGKRGRRIKRQAAISLTGRQVGVGSTAGGTGGLGEGTVFDLEKLFGSEETGTKTTAKSLLFESYVAPNITTKLKEKVVVKVGDPFNVTMRVTGHPMPEIFWIKQGTREVDFDQRLNFPKTKIEDSGIWTFRARNIMGTATAEFELVVGKKPVFIKEPQKNVVAYEGRTFEFKCDVDGHPEPVIGWKRQGNAVLPAGRHKIIKETLYLTDPKPEDAGLYLCRAANVMGAVIGGSRIFIQKIAPLTVKILNPAEVVYKDTTPLKLNCSATGNPQPNITWYKDGVALKANILVKRPSRTNPLPEYLSQLVIDQVSTKDEGTYTCSMRTSLAPQPVEYNTTVSLFKCKPLEAPANGYIVGKNFHVGACVKFACNPGCMLYGSAIRVCNAHGKWSGTAPTCYDVGEVAYECHHYNVLTDADRNVNSKKILGKCDNNLAEGWYRFGGEAGTQMPISCQGPRKCNAKYPGWLYGQHPRKEDGCIQTHVCFGDYKSKCCAYKQNVLVRNCGKFYVYKLSPSPGCNMRYCAKD
ncbi:uncharacterized protein LOC116288925 isoform X2 [Actinia tenebrosa]|uniref:Uncharacterized protein LOC116288925 isoform X2 n=1 Tax=Actinia tenebrosa TaxID=6105 RepID=A0A6P8H5K2_ACTTE|nr:uncharacterized protein LOC116288925 isoform X2 [Actinia tenebrosa]